MVKMSSILIYPTNIKINNMNRYLIILGLETLLEQVKNSDNNKERIKEINEQITIIKEYDYNK
jgi:hypothetical protein